MNAAVVTNLARSLWSDLRERHLWPVALVLLVALVAVPVLLMHSSPSAPAPVPVAATGAAPPGIPAVNAQGGATQANLPGHGRDPFGGQPHSGGAATAGGTASTTGSTASTAGAGAKGSASSTGSTPVGSGGGAATSTSPPSVVSTPAPAGGAPPPPVPARKPSPPPTGLSPLQSYGVSLSMTDNKQGVNEVDGLQRLTLLPNAQQPLLVEWGVLQGGHRVQFVVAPGTVLRGPGACVPGPLDCELLSLAPDQIESVSTDPNSAPVAMFAITDIAAVSHSSRAAAQQARQSVSLAGSQFLTQVPLQALSLFPYDASVGAVVDMRNLTVGG